jgi:hypothetical protein
MALPRKGHSASLLVILGATQKEIPYLFYSTGSGIALIQDLYLG